MDRYGRRNPRSRSIANPDPRQRQHCPRRQHVRSHLFRRRNRSLRFRGNDAQAWRPHRYRHTGRRRGGQETTHILAPRRHGRSRNRANWPHHQPNRSTLTRISRPYEENRPKWRYYNQTRLGSVTHRVNQLKIAFPDERVSGTPRELREALSKLIGARPSSASSH